MVWNDSAYFYKTLLQCNDRRGCIDYPTPRLAAIACVLSGPICVEPLCAGISLTLKLRACNMVLHAIRRSARTHPVSGWYELNVVVCILNRTERSGARDGLTLGQEVRAGLLLRG